MILSNQESKLPSSFGLIDHVNRDPSYLGTNGSVLLVGRGRAYDTNRLGCLLKVLISAAKVFINTASYNSVSAARRGFVRAFNKVVSTTNSLDIRSMKRISDKRTKNQAKNDKTEHGIEKRGQAKVKKSTKSKSIPDKVKVSAGHKIDLHMLCRHCGAGTGTHINIGFDGPCMQENRGKLSITTDGCESQDTYYHCIYEYDLLTRIGLMDDAMVYLYLNVGCERAHSVFVVEFFFMNKKSSREQSLGVAFRGQISLLRLEVCAREERWGDLVFYLSRVISLVNGMRQTAGG
ncbi:hypothetical protein Tco_0311570 [Tanacetum coccineum]